MSNNSESGKMSDIARGIKRGAVKTSVDSIIAIVADPMSKTLRETLNLDDNISGELSDALVRFIIMIGVAGGLDMLGPQLEGVIGEAGDEKSKLLAAYLREYAGENLGEKGMRLVVESIPELFKKFKDIPTEDIKEALGEKSVVYTKDILDFQVEEVGEKVPRTSISKQLQEQILHKQEEVVENVKR